MEMIRDIVEWSSAVTITADIVDRCRSFHLLRGVHCVLWSSGGSEWKDYRELDIR